MLWSDDYVLKKQKELKLFDYEETVVIYNFSRCQVCTYQALCQKTELVLYLYSFLFLGLGLH